MIITLDYFLFPLILGALFALLTPAGRGSFAIFEKSLGLIFSVIWLIYHVVKKSNGDTFLIIVAIALYINGYILIRVLKNKIFLKRRYSINKKEKQKQLEQLQEIINSDTTEVQTNNNINKKNTLERLFNTDSTKKLDATNILNRSLDKTNKMKQIINILDTSHINVLDVDNWNDIANKSSHREKAYKDLYDLCAKDIILSRLVTEYDVTEEDIKNLSQQIQGTGYAWVNTDYMPVSTFCFYKPFKYILENRNNLNNINNQSIVFHNLQLYFEENNASEVYTL